MRNKFFGRSIAALVAVMMLGTVAFAADVVTGDKGALKPDGYQAGQATHTLFAFGAESADADIAYAIDNSAKIIAVEQSATTAPKISIDSSKLDGANYVIVYYSGDAATEAKRTVIPVSDDAAVIIEIADEDVIDSTDIFTEVELEDSETGEKKKYTDLMAVTYTFSLENINAWGCVGAAFTQTESGDEYTIGTTDIASLFDDNSDGNVEITFGFTGVTAEDGEFTAIPVYQEYQQQ